MSLLTILEKIVVLNWTVSSEPSFWVLWNPESLTCIKVLTKKLFKPLLECLRFSKYKRHCGPPPFPNSCLHLSFQELWTDEKSADSSQVLIELSNLRLSRHCQLVKVYKHEWRFRTKDSWKYLLFERDFLLNVQMSSSCTTLKTSLKATNIKYLFSTKNKHCTWSFCLSIHYLFCQINKTNMHWSLVVYWCFG